MAGKKVTVSAADLVKQLATNPEWQRQHDQYQSARDDDIRRFEVQSATINAALRQAGASPDRLAAYDGQQAMRPAIDVFVRELPLAQDDRLKAVMASAIANINADPFFDEIRALFLAEFGKSRKSVVTQRLAVAVADCVNSKANLAKLVSMTCDVSLGPVRVLFLERLKAVKDPAMVKILEELSRDPELAKAITSWRAYWKRHNPAMLQDDAAKPER